MAAPNDPPERRALYRRRVDKSDTKHWTTRIKNEETRLLSPPQAHSHSHSHEMSFEDTSESAKRFLEDIESKFGRIEADTVGNPDAPACGLEGFLLDILYFVIPGTSLKDDDRLAVRASLLGAAIAEAVGRVVQGNQDGLNRAIHCFRRAFVSWGSGVFQQSRMLSFMDEKLCEDACISG